VTRILAIADEKTRSLTVAKIRDIAPDVVVSCGDLPFKYVEYVADAANKPFLYVPGNHDPELKRDPQTRFRDPRFEQDWDDEVGPQGGCNLDGNIIEEGGLTFAGLGGSIRYRPGANKYTERQMEWRVRRLEAKRQLRRLRGRRKIDVFVAHSPPRNLGDMPDTAHRGFASFIGLLERLEPQVMLHGHIHPHGFQKPDRTHRATTLINVVPYRVVEVQP
jgi:Icc-related predicted phosphoesterase